MNLIDLTAIPETHRDGVKKNIEARLHAIDHEIVPDFVCNNPEYH